MRPLNARPSQRMLSQSKISLPHSCESGCDRLPALGGLLVFKPDVVAVAAFEVRATDDDDVPRELTAFLRPDTADGALENLLGGGDGSEHPGGRAPDGWCGARRLAEHGGKRVHERRGRKERMRGECMRARRERGEQQLREQ